jgi:hypothetical protein
VAVDGKYWDWRERQKKLELEREDDVMYMNGYYDAYADDEKNQILEWNPAYDCGYLDGLMDLRQDIEDQLSKEIIEAKREKAWDDLMRLENPPYGR